MPLMFPGDSCLSFLILIQEQHRAEAHTLARPLTFFESPWRPWERRKEGGVSFSGSARTWPCGAPGGPG